MDHFFFSSWTILGRGLCFYDQKAYMSTQTLAYQIS